MSSQPILTSTDPSVDTRFPRVTGTTSGAKHALDVSVINTSLGSPLSNVSWDALDVQQTSATVETYVFKTGGLAGTTVATCVVTYTAADKANLDTVVWS